MANGFIPPDGPGSLEIKGNDIFNELAWRSFFQDVKLISPISTSYRSENGHCSQTKCKMHDLIHDLAQSIIGDECLSTLEVPAQVNNPLINVRHISLKTFPLDINKAINCFPSIRSLIASSNYDQPSLVRNIEFPKSNSLRILELHIWPFERTVFTPKKMKHLRYLELSSSRIKSLPEAITTLYLMQTLRLFQCCNLSKLPEGIRYMSSLQHLYIENCFSLRSMPSGLGQLNCLQILTYIVGIEAGNGIAELKNLNLHGQLHLYNLRKIKDVGDAMEANLIAKQNIDNLALCWGEPEDYRSAKFEVVESKTSEFKHCDPFAVLEALKPCNNLKVLQITQYRGSKFPVWMMEYLMLEKLIELYIIECRNCTNIPPVEKLPLLQILHLKYLDNLRYICNNGSMNTEVGEDARIAFPSLKSMLLSEMPNLSSWCEGEVGDKTSLIFPQLNSLDISNCPKLTAMPIVPLLKSMSVRGNKILSCFATGLTKLQVLSLESQGLKAERVNGSIFFKPCKSLTELILNGYDSIVPLYEKEGDMVNITLTAPGLRSLEIISYNIFLSCTPLNAWFWKCFTFVEYLSINNCDSLVFWPEEELRSLKCLKKIEVLSCRSFLGSLLESTLQRSNTEPLLPKLEELLIFECPSVIELPKCSMSIQRLFIFACPNLQCLPEWLGSMVSLKNLGIGQCEKLKSLPLNIGGLTRLETLVFNGWPNLTCFPEEMQVLKALKNLVIQCCPKIRILPKGLAQHLKNLDLLWIEGCPHLERHFWKYGKYRQLIIEIQITKIGEERRSDILRNLQCRCYHGKALSIQHSPN